MTLTEQGSAQETHGSQGSNAELAEEISVSLDYVNSAMAALMQTLAGADPQAMISTRALRSLLAPVHDQISQAQASAQIMREGLL